MNSIKRRLTWPLAGYIILVIGILYANIQVVQSGKASDRAQQASLMSGCIRGNELRVQINGQNEAFLDNNRTTYELFATITKGAPETRPVVKQIRKATAEYQSIEAHYRPLPMVNCEKAYPATP